VSASLAAPPHLHSTQYSTSLAGPASSGLNVANLGVDTIQPQLGESLATPARVITPSEVERVRILRLNFQRLAEAGDGLLPTPCHKIEDNTPRPRHTLQPHDRISFSASMPNSSQDRRWRWSQFVQGCSQPF
jgi:hypothetical protein